MKPRYLNNRPFGLSSDVKKTEIRLLSSIAILTFLLGFTSLLPKTIAADQRLDTINNASNTIVGSTSTLPPVPAPAADIAAYTSAQTALSQNQVAVAEMLNTNKPADSAMDLWNKNQLLASQNLFVENSPQFKLTQGQLRLLEKYYQLNTDSARSAALRELSGSSRANSIMMGMNPYWNSAFDNLKLRAPNVSARSSRGSSTWRPSQVYESAVMYDMNGSAPSEYVVPGSMYVENDFSAPEPEHYIEIDEYLDSSPMDDSGVYGNSPPLFFDGEPVEVEGEVLYEYFGQCPHRMEPIHFWVNPYYSGKNVTGDRNSDSYNISGMGVQFGGHVNLGRHSAFGVVIGYSDPVLTQHHARFTANDYHIGFYGGTLINHTYEFKGYLGFGFQDYTSSRTAIFPGVNQRVTGRTSGENFAMSFELARPIYQRGGLWRPYIALDVNDVQQDGYTEYGDAIALQYADASLTKTYFRLGANREIYRGNWKIRAGMAYSTQLGGKSAPESFEQLAGTSWGVTEYGVDTARDFIHGNVGLEYYLNRCRTTSLYSDYNVHASKRETDYIVSFGFKWLM